MEFLLAALYIAWRIRKSILVQLGDEPSISASLRVPAAPLFHFLIGSTEPPELLIFGHEPHGDLQLADRVQMEHILNWSQFG